MAEMYSNFSDKNPECRITEFIEVRPWDRFFARVLDYIIFVSLVFFLCGLLFSFKPDVIMSLILYMSAILYGCLLKVY